MRKGLGTLAIITALALVATACGGSEDAGSTTEPAGDTTAAGTDFAQLIVGFWSTGWGEVEFTADRMFTFVDESGAITDRGQYSINQGAFASADGNLFTLFSDDDSPTCKGRDSFTVRVLSDDSLNANSTGEWRSSECERRANALKSMSRLEGFSVTP